MADPTPHAAPPFNPVLPDRRRPEVQTLKADGRRMLDVYEVCVHLNCTPETVRKLTREGVLRAVKYSPRVTRYPEAAVLAFINR